MTSVYIINEKYKKMDHRNLLNLMIHERNVLSNLVKKDILFTILKSLLSCHEHKMSFARESFYSFKLKTRRLVSILLTT